MKKTNFKFLLFLSLFLFSIACCCCISFNTVNTTQASAEDKKQMNVVFDAYPVYIKYSESPSGYDNLKDYFVIENDELISSRNPSSSTFQSNRYVYNSTLNYNVMPYSKSKDGGEPYYDRFFTNGEGYYDLKLTITDTSNQFEPYEIYIENFYIVQNEEGVPVPEFSAVFNGEKQTASISPDQKYSATINDGGIDVGEYSVTLEIKYPEVFFWSGIEDKTQTTVQTTFKILKETNNTISSLDITPWTYGSYNPETNSPQETHKLGNVNFEYYDSNSVLVDDISIAKPGRYTLKAIINETDNYSGATKEVEFEIGKQTVQRPATLSTEFVFNGNEQTYEIAENPLYTISGNKKTNAGNHTITIALADPETYAWDNGSSENLQYDFIIKKKPIASPTIENKTYSGKQQIANVSETNDYEVHGENGNLGGTNVGNYKVFLILKDANNCYWQDNTDQTKATIELSFTIVKNNSNSITSLGINNWQYGLYSEEANKPNAEATFGQPNLSFKDLNGNNVENIENAKAGRYVLVATVESTDNYNGTAKEVEFEILKRKVIAPEKNLNTFVYNGAEQTYFDFENSAYTILNNKQTKAGSHNVIVSLNDKDNFEWTNGTTIDLIFPWKIDKAKIVASFENKNGCLFLKLENPDDENKIDVSYFDKNNNAVDVSKLANGEKYVIFAELKDSENFEFATKDGDNFVEFNARKTFTYSKNNFWQNYWWLIVIIAILAIGASLAPVIVKFKKKKQKAN